MISYYSFIQDLSYTYGSDISATGWKRSANGTRMAYDFSYDGLHRLKDAVYKEGSSVNNHYTEKVTGYDRNGNITTLQRYGRTGASSWGVVDNLTLTRTGNQLTSVSDSGSAAYSGDFNAAAGASTYNANGALATDSGRGISSVTWNEIDLPQTVTFSNGSTINYYYSADGTKLREVRTVSGTATTIDWCGDLVLEKVGNGTRAAKRLRLDGGYVDLATGVTARRHFVRDHLGSVRAVVNDSGTVLETDDYYPLGGPLPTGTSTALQPEKYQGKEWNPAAAFNVYDFGARLYDPALGRWISQDPMAEKYYPQSPYLFCAGNPLKFVDPEGNDAIYIAFPKYRADGYPLTGHAGVLLIDNRTGYTKYYEYGRYDGNIKGVVRNYAVPNVKMEDGMPSVESLNKVLSFISNRSGKGQVLEGAYVASDHYDVMNNYANEKYIENGNESRTPYNIFNNNCGTFADDVIKQDRSVDTPLIIDPRPVSIIKEYQRVFTPIEYDPGKGTAIKTTEGTKYYNLQTNTTEIKQNWWQKIWYGPQ